MALCHRHLLTQPLTEIVPNVRESQSYSDVRAQSIFLRIIVRAKYKEVLSAWERMSAGGRLIFFTMEDLYTHTHVLIQV